MRRQSSSEETMLFPLVVSFMKEKAGRADGGAGWESVSILESLSEKVIQYLSKDRIQ